MLTPRGWWFLIVVVFVLVIGAFVVPNYTTVPAILATTLFVWFVYEWVQFNTRSNAAVSNLRVRRWVLQGGRSTPMIWAGVPFEVRVRVRHDGLVTVGYAVIEDRLPAGADILDGETDATTSIRSGDPVDVTYTLRCPAPGVLRFEGVKVRVADLHGFFYRRVFLRDPVEFLVLPPLSGHEGRQRADKRFNTLPPPGIHRIRRPGSGDELLDLRDYRPGDPPKMIAWKASAKKDKLITKEYENDVPVRCVLFLDTSEGVRLGPPGNSLLTRLAGVAAVVSQASAANRDLVGLTTFDDTAATGLKPARTQTHMIGVLRKLAEVSALQPGTTGVPPEHLTRRAYPLAHELYPELMRRSTNTMPLGRLWIPLLDRWWGWIVVFVLVAPPALAAYKFTNILGGPPLPGPFQKIYQSWMSGTFDAAVRLSPRVFWVARILIALAIWAVLLCLPTVFAALFWFFYGFRGWFGVRARRPPPPQATGGAVLPPGRDRARRRRAIRPRRRRVRRARRRVPPAPPAAVPGAAVRRVRPVPVQVRAEGRRAGRGDHPRRRPRPRQRTVRHPGRCGGTRGRPGTAREGVPGGPRRRHHVMVIVPWPADVPSPDEAPAAVAVEKEGKKRRRHPDDLFDSHARHKRIVKIVQDNLTRQYHEAFRAMRRELSRVGATVMRVNDGDPVRLVLDRLDRLRGMRSRR